MIFFVATLSMFSLTIPIDFPEKCNQCGIIHIAAPARDGNIAIMEEYQSALAGDTVQGYELFIARHPDHPLAAAIRKQLEIRKKR